MYDRTQFISPDYIRPSRDDSCVKRSKATVATCATRSAARLSSSNSGFANGLKLFSYGYTPEYDGALQKFTSWTARSLLGGFNYFFFLFLSSAPGLYRSLVVSFFAILVPGLPQAMDRGKMDRCCETSKTRISGLALRKRHSDFYYGANFFLPVWL